MRDKRKLKYVEAKKRKRLSVMSITNWLIIINVVFFLVFLPLMVLSGQNCESNVRNSDCYIKYVAVNPKIFFEDYYFWTLLTSVFMHGNFFHLFINMFVLFSLGNLAEKIIGRNRFFWFYIISGIIASLFFVMLGYFFGNTDLGAAIFGGRNVFAVGASGAIFAVAGLFMILTPRLRFAIIFLPFFTLPAYIMIPLVLVLTWVVSSSAGFGIGNTAHFGGFLAGVFYALYLRNKYKRKTRMIEKYFSG